MSRRPPAKVWLVEEFGHGGIGRYAVDVANLVGASASTVVATSALGPVPGLRGRSVRWFPRPPGGALGRGFGGLVGLVRALRSVRRGDVAWVPLGIRPFFELALVLVLRARRASVVATIHNRGPHGAGDSRVVRQAAGLSHVVVVHTDPLARWAKEHGLRARRLPFPPPDVQQGVDDGVARAELGAAEDDVVLSMLGYLYAYKGVDVLVDAFLAARHERPSLAVHLILAGRLPSGPGSARVLDALARLDGVPRVTLRTGWLEEEELSALLAATDVIALPYREIDNSGSGSLARSRGVPALASDLDGLREIFGDAAVYVPPEDVEGLSQALLALPGRLPSLRKAIAAADPPADLSGAYRAFVEGLLAEPAARGGGG